MLLQEIREHLNSTRTLGPSPPDVEYMTIEISKRSRVKFHCSDIPPVKAERRIMRRMFDRHINGRTNDEKLFSVLDNMEIHHPPIQNTIICAFSMAVAIGTVICSLVGPQALGINLPPFGPATTIAIEAGTIAIFGATTAFLGSGILRNRAQEDKFLAEICRAALFESRGEEILRDDALSKAATAFKKTHHGARCSMNTDQVEDLFAKDVGSIVADIKAEIARENQVARGEIIAKENTQARVRATQREHPAEDEVSKSFPTLKEKKSLPADNFSFLKGPPQRGASPSPESSRAPTRRKAEPSRSTG